MGKHPLKQARELWEAGKYLDAGRLLYEALPHERRPGWAAEILAAVTPYAPQTPAIDRVLEVARTPARWHEGHDAFDAVRAIRRQVNGTDRLYDAILILAENTAKVTFNATWPSAPFDADSGWRLVPNLMAVCALVDDPQLTGKVWSTLTFTPLM